MRTALRLLVGCLFCSFVVLMASSSLALGEASSFVGSTPSSPLEGPLVVPGVPDEGQQEQAVDEAKRTNPEAVAAREESQTKYEGLSSSQAVTVVSEAFPSVINEPAGGPPPLPAGQKITGFVNANVAQTELGGGQSGLIESAAPMAVGSSGGQWSPLNLGLHEANGAFVTTNSLVEVGIPKRLADGVILSSAGISVLPTDSSDSALGGAEGALDGASVIYANTQTDTDTVVKPTTYGLAVDAVLRSVESPQELDYKIALPQGASLVQKEASGPVQVVKEGVAIATVPTPSARDAEGTVVPVKVSASAETITLSIDHRSGSYKYPIAVDPEFDEVIESVVPGNWHFTGGNGYSGKATMGGLEILHTGAWEKGDLGYWAYQAEGITDVYEVNTGHYDPFEPYAYATAWVEIATPHEQRELVLNGLPMTESHKLCWNAECSPTGVSADNSAFTALVINETTAEFEMHTGGGCSPNPCPIEADSTPEVYLAEEKGQHTSVSYNEISSELDGTTNLFDTTKEVWLSPHEGAFEFTARDSGLGVSRASVEKNPTETGGEVLVSNNYLTGSSCIGIQCSSPESNVETYNTLAPGNLPEGEYRIRASAESAMPNTNSRLYKEGEKTIRVDATPPHGIAVSGLPLKGEELQLGEVEGHLKIEARDGEGAIPSSGIKSIELYVDDHEVSTASGSCGRGPCTASGEWSLNGAELGAGHHTLTVRAIDNAHNEATKTYQLSVYSANPVSMGPGSVNPESGDFALGATDVDLSGGSGSLEVTRHYDSRNVKEGGEGPVGPQWTVSLGSLASLEVLPDGSVLVVGPNGLAHFSVKTGGGYEAPIGDANLELTLEQAHEGKGADYLLKDLVQDTSTEFTLPTGAKSWMPTVSKGPVATNTVTDEYKSVEVSKGKYIVQPTLELAPHPNITCTQTQLEKLEIAAKGCRALKFEYGSATTATGEAEIQWGEYKNYLKEVIAVAYNPATKAMTKIAVAKYEYDGQGRLRAEWNPQISPALRTTYGYDTEDQITALTPPGQETWAFTYGTIMGDSSAGRLLKMTRAPAAAKLWKGEAPKIKELPKISGTPAVGIKMGVSEGVWENEPVAYAYQWEDCNSKGEACTPILGATNPNYTVTASDGGHRLAVLVSGTNGGGSVTAASLASSEVTTGEFTEYALPSNSKPLGIAEGPDGNLWFTDSGTGKIGKITSAGEVTEYKAENHEPDGITTGPDGNLWFVEHETQRIGHITTSGTVTEYTPQRNGQDDCIVTGPDGNLWFTDASAGYILKVNTSDQVLGEYALPTGSEPTGIAVGPDKNLWFTDYGTNKIGKITTTGTITEYTLPTGSHPDRITTGPDGNLWFTDYGSGNGGEIGKITTAGTITEYKLPSGSTPQGITTGADKNLWFTNSPSHKIGRITTSGVITEFTLPNNGAPREITSGPEGKLWYTNYESNTIGKLNPSPAEGTQYPPSPGSTIEYNAPLSGSGAPEQMTNSEVAKWGQKDDPEYATAIFSPENPQNWPATKYEGATVYYMDNQARTVNVKEPAGGIATKEYNENNNVIRTLTADDRATALKQGDPEEAAKLLSTESRYNGETLKERNEDIYLIPGTELLETHGPQHPVRLSSGSEVQARDHTKYAYDQGQPQGETYDLVTESTEGAEYEGKEADVRTTKTSYSGQSNLGWKLREPTSVTKEPSGLGLTTTTVYEENAKKESSGKVAETRTPAATGKDTAVPPAYSLAFGAKGTAGGQFEGPEQDAVDSHGDIWVADYTNHRIQEFSSSGTFMLAVGWGVKDGKAEAETCTSSCKAGISGSGSGQFEGPYGIAVNQSTNNVYVSDYVANRVEEISSAGAFVASFGSKGTSGGQFSSPEGVAIDSSGDVWVADSANSRTQELSSSGTFMLAVGWGVKDGKAEAETCTSSCKAGISGSGNGQLAGPTGIAFSGGNAYVSDNGNDRVDEFSSAGAYVSKFGTKGTSAAQFEGVSAITTEATSGDLYVADSGNDRVQKLTAAGAFVAAFGSKGSSNGQLSLPAGAAINSTGDVYVSDHSNNRVEEWIPAIEGNEGAHDTKTIYYSAKTEAEVVVCQEHPEWAGLPCETKPLAQPGTAGLPELPVTEYKYNIWDQPEIVTEKFGSTTRTKTTTFDGAGRPLTSEETSTVDTVFPKVTDKYNESNGTLETQSITVEGKVKTITTHSNTLGEITSYTDAAGSTTTYEYEKEKDARLLKMSYVVGTETFSQSYGYEEASGAIKELIDAATGKDPAAGKFTATYDAEGDMSTESYPNNMTAIYTRNALGQATGIEYVKNADCATKCPETWFSDSVTPSIHGETLAQTSTLAHEKYAYDPIGRLDETEETPVGKGCVTRLYAYDEESNRTALTQRESATETCAKEGGSTEWHTYDTANRLTDPGVSYDPFGNTTKLPSPDAGEHELTSSYYVDNQVASQTQNGTTINYNYDPAGRTLEAISAGTTKISHYAGPGEVLSWISEGSEKWTRNIFGIDGTLAAIQSNAGTPVLQLHDLNGNIVATASVSETETKLLTKYNSTEFGVPTTKEAPKYAWLGADGVASELSSSGTITQDGVTYVPQTGRPLQTESIVPPLPTNAGVPFVSTIEPWVAEAAASAAARQVAAAEAARKALEVSGGSTGCNIYTEGCAADPEHGKNEFGCKLVGSWGVEAEINVSFDCRATPSATQVEIEIWRVEDGKYVPVVLNSEAWNFKRDVSYASEDYSCEAGKWYRGWVYARVWAYNVFVWSDAYVLSDNKKCYVQGDLIPPGESGIEGDETPQPPED